MPYIIGSNMCLSNCPVENSRAINTRMLRQSLPVPYTVSAAVIYRYITVQFMIFAALVMPCILPERIPPMIKKSVVKALVRYCREYTCICMPHVDDTYCTDTVQLKFRSKVRVHYVPLLVKPTMVVESYTKC